MPTRQESCSVPGTQEKGKTSKTDSCCCLRQPGVRRRCQGSARPPLYLACVQGSTLVHYPVQSFRCGLGWDVYCKGQRGCLWPPGWKNTYTFRRAHRGEQQCVFFMRRRKAAHSPSTPSEWRLLINMASTPGAAIGRVTHTSCVPVDRTDITV